MNKIFKTIGYYYQIINEDIHVYEVYVTNICKKHRFKDYCIINYIHKTKRTDEQFELKYWYDEHPTVFENLDNLLDHIWINNKMVPTQYVLEVLNSWRASYKLLENSTI